MGTGRHRRADAARGAGVVVGVLAVVMGAAFFFGESFTDDEVDCGVSAIDLARGRAGAEGDAEFRRACQQAGEEDVALGYGAAVAGLALAIGCVRSRWGGRDRQPKESWDHVPHDAGRARAWTWRRVRPGGPWVGAAAAAVVIVSPVAVVAAPVEPLLIVVSAVVFLVAGAAVAVTVAAWPAARPTPDGLDVRRRPWQRRLLVPWHDIDQIQAGALGIVLHTRPTGRRAEELERLTDDQLERRYSGTRGLVRALLDASADGSTIWTSLYRRGQTRPRHPDMERAAEEIARAVAAHTGRSPEHAASLIGPSYDDEPGPGLARLR